MVNLILTGATGFLGSAVTRVLVERGERVLALGRGDTPPDARVTWIPHDLTTPALPEGLAEADTVIHLAQSRRYREFPEAASDIFAVNVGSTIQLLDWAQRSGARRVVLTSSGGVYGRGPHPFTEDDPLAPPGVLDFYLETKRAAELLAVEYAPHVNVVVLRPFFIYGREQRASMLVPRLVRSIVSGDPIRLDGPNGLRLNPVHLDDAVRAVVAALEIDSTTHVNVAGPEALNLRQMSEIIGRHVGREPIFDVADAAPGNLIGDTERMVSVLAPPRITFENGVRHLCLEIVREIS